MTKNEEYYTRISYMITGSPGEYKFLTRNVFPCLVLPTGGCRNPEIRTRALVPTRKVEEREEEEEEREGLSSSAPHALPPLQLRPSYR